MHYPKYLLPRWYFRIFTIDELRQSGTFYVVRRSLKSTYSETFELGLAKYDSLVNVNEDSNQAKLTEIAGLSKNILGGYFRVEHLCFSSGKFASKYWSEEEKLPDFQRIVDDVKFRKGSIPIYFPISKIHNKDFPFVKNLDEDKSYKKKLPEQFRKSSGKVKLTAKTVVLHKPTICNFWHVEFWLKDTQTGTLFSKDNISSYKEGRSTSDQRAGTQVAKMALETILIISSTDNVRSYDSIPRHIYIKPLNLFNKELIRLINQVRKSIKALASKFPIPSIVRQYLE